MDNAIATSANNNAINPSFVNGPVRKIGNDAFTFPIGKTGEGYRSCSISAPLLVTDVFTAEFIRSSAKNLGPITATGLTHVSNCEYWNIDRTVGISPVNVTIEWSGSSNCNGAVYVNDLSTLTVAHFNGTTWDSHGKNSVTGTVSSGTITWNNVSSFSPFALGSTSNATNPLPVKFTSVKAWPVAIGNTVEWTNETEKDVASYEIQRSSDGMNFITVQVLAPRNNIGTRSDYSVHDPVSYNGTVYYRIKAVEIQGSSTFSSIVRVTKFNSSSTSLNLYPNPVSDRRINLQVQNFAAGYYNLNVFDLSGRKIHSQSVQIRGNSYSQSIFLPASVNKGEYMIQITGAGTSMTKAFLVQ